MAVPSTIPAPRWAALASTSARLLHTHGAALHSAGWGTLDVWGLHPTAPVTNPPGWGLAWLLGAAGVVLDVAPGVVGMTSHRGGNRLTLRPSAAERPEIVPAWTL